MKEHKFKVWDKTERRMITKNIIEFYSDGGLVVQEQDINKGVQREIDNPIIIEYTGLKDKNVKEIYALNWLRWNNDFYWVNWDEFNGCWYGEPHIGNVNIGILTAPSFKDTEVGGNTLENPEQWWGQTK